MHDCNHLKIFNRAAESSKYDIFVVSLNEPKVFPTLRNKHIRKLLKIIELFLCHADLGKEIYRNKNKEAIIVHGFSTVFLFFTYICSFFRTKNVYVLTHHNIQQAFQNPIYLFFLKCYCILDYKFIVNESSNILKELKFSNEKISDFISILHPVVKVDQFKDYTEDISEKIGCGLQKVKIGLIGKLRIGKQFSKTVNLLLKLQEKYDFTLVIGTDQLAVVNHLKNRKIIKIDTSLRHEYYATLGLCDAIVLNYEEDKYFYRCSGVAADAIGVGTYVICRDYPLMRNQLNFPAPVGELYKTDEGLEIAILKLFGFYPNANSKNFVRHYEKRSTEIIALNFLKDIESRIIQDI